MATIASCADLATKQDTLLDCTGAALPANTQMAKCSDLTAYQLSLRDCTGAVITANTQIAKCTDLALKQDALQDCTGATLPANTQIAKCTDLALKQDVLRDCTGATLPANTQIAKCTDLALKQDALQDCNGVPLAAGTKVYVCGTIATPDVNVGEVMQIGTSVTRTYGGRDFSTFNFDETRFNYVPTGATPTITKSANGLTLKAGRKYRIDWSMVGDANTTNVWTNWLITLNGTLLTPPATQIYFAANFNAAFINSTTNTFFLEPTVDTVLTVRNNDGTTASSWTYFHYLSNLLTATVIA